MKCLIEQLVFIAFIFGLFFIFQGEPDLWDKWHKQAMETCKK